MGVSRKTARIAVVIVVEGGLLAAIGFLMRFADRRNRH